MKLNTLLIQLAIVTTGLTLSSAQADFLGHRQDVGHAGLIKVKGGEDGIRHFGNDDIEKDRKRGKKRLRDTTSGQGAVKAADPRIMQRSDMPSFKERLYLQRKQQREEAEAAAAKEAEAVDQKN